VAADCNPVERSHLRCYHLGDRLTQSAGCMTHIPAVGHNSAEKQQMSTIDNPTPLQISCFLRKKTVSENCPPKLRREASDCVNSLSPFRSLNPKKLGAMERGFGQNKSSLPVCFVHSQPERAEPHRSHTYKNKTALVSTPPPTIFIDSSIQQLSSSRTNVRGLLSMRNS
jgi:hypothetical protein